MWASILGDELWFTHPGIPRYLSPSGTLGYRSLSNSLGMQGLTISLQCSLVSSLRLHQHCVMEHVTGRGPSPSDIWQSWATRNIQSWAGWDLCAGKELGPVLSESPSKLKFCDVMVPFPWRKGIFLASLWSVMDCFCWKVSQGNLYIYIKKVIYSFPDFEL